MNGALDYDSSFTLTGGTVVALGSSGMAQSVSSSDQGVLAFTVSMAENTILNVQDSNGNDLLTVASPKSYSCAVFTSPDLVSGESYTVYSGGSYSVESVNGVYSGGTYTDGTKLGSIDAS